MFNSFPFTLSSLDLQESDTEDGRSKRMELVEGDQLRSFGIHRTVDEWNARGNRQRKEVLPTTEME